MTSLRPTPDTGRVPATRQPSQPIGPSWAERQGRAARRAFRQATREGDDARAFEIASRARKLGLPEKSTIGSAEQRMKRQRLQPMADDAISAEQEAATLTGRAVPDETPPAQLEPPTPKPVPGAAEPPQNPVSGNRNPEPDGAAPQLPMGDKPLGPRLPSRFAPQGLEGRQQFAANLRRSIDVGGELSGERFDRARAEARRLGVTDQQLADELQEIGTSIPTAEAKKLQPVDNASLDERLRRYQDRYLGGGPASELSGRLKASALAARQSAAQKAALSDAPLGPQAQAPAPIPLSAGPLGPAAPGRFDVPQTAPIPESATPLGPALPPSPRQNPAVGALSRLAGAVTSRFEGSIRGYAGRPAPRPAINLPEPGALAARAGLAAASAVGSVNDRVASLAARGVSGAASRARALADPAAQLAAAAAATSESAREVNARVARILEEARAKARRTSR